jgi:undecaprenyl diphosphate synthase
MIGRIEGLRKSLRDKVLKGIEMTKDNDRLVLNVAFNYGGRDEIAQAVQRIVKDGVKAEDVTEELISRYMYTTDIPDPDLVIRTSGEQRISNFLIWQAAYAEWIFPKTFWPDFDREELLAAIQEYGKRERRYGLVLQN